MMCEWRVHGLALTTLQNACALHTIGYVNVNEYGALVLSTSMHDTVTSQYQLSECNLTFQIFNGIRATLNMHTVVSVIMRSCCWYSGRIPGEHCKL